MATELPRYITVIGQGEATAAPDIATVRLGVQTTASTARQALSDNNRKMEALIAKLRQLGVADRDMQTSTINLNQHYGPRGDGPIGYEAHNAVVVTIRALDQFGGTLDAIVDAGANNVGGIHFMIDDPTTLERQARDAAIVNARERADQMARTAGVMLGELISINEAVGGPVVFAMNDEIRSSRAKQAGTPIQSGELIVRAQLQITFAIA
jgi:uncharacterized protein